MVFCVVTLFPEMIDAALSHGVVGRAREKGIIKTEFVNIRDFAVNKYGQTDDYPYGGGAGMVLMPVPFYGAFLKARSIVGSITAAEPKNIYLTPQGKPFCQKKARELAEEAAVILLCGHYEGVDERVIQEIEPDEVSLGDFVMSGGEIAALAVIDSVARLVPGVLGNKSSPEDESFGDGLTGGLLEYPQYTRPAVFCGRTVPDVLLSGHHANIERWRREQAHLSTARKRPELLRAELLKNME